MTEQQQQEQDDGTEIDPEVVRCKDALLDALLKVAMRDAEDAFATTMAIASELAARTIGAHVDDDQREKAIEVLAGHVRDGLVTLDRAVAQQTH